MNEHNQEPPRAERSLKLSLSIDTLMTGLSSRAQLVYDALEHYKRSLLEELMADYRQQLLEADPDDLLQMSKDWYSIQAIERLQAGITYKAIRLAESNFWSAFGSQEPQAYADVLAANRPKENQLMDELGKIFVDLKPAADHE